MGDCLYRPEDVDPKIRPIFEQLRKEFEAPYQVWWRADDFDRQLCAGVLNPSTQVAATIALNIGTRLRTTPLGQSEIQKIRKHFASDSKEDLNL